MNSLKKHRQIALLRRAIGFTALLLLIITVRAAPSQVFYVRAAPESATDLRYEYDNAVLKLTLKKTENDYGPWQIEIAPTMNFARTVHTLKTGKYENFIAKLSYEDRFNDWDVIFAPFPIDLGIVSYRVCFTSQETKERLRRSNTLAQLKSFTHGQGDGWSDIGVLRQNGFEVTEVTSYESLFKMVAANRFDLFCRGTNELLDEYQSHRDIENLTYDTSIAIHYPLPRFFYTHSSNTAALERIYRGLQRAHDDGSLIALWQDHYGASIDFVKFHERTIYTLTNPNLQRLSDDYRQYFYTPVGP
ncbi:hypothetical protein [Marinobacter caseinilyticus]|uniref:hypothetical protein n=1 Tax=Marinobacter caseinilyticus TaxID=2692195 RepID=UPI00140C41CD|nr:hypothetical protein [Marinobacter caseinilyticus]